MSRSHRRRGVRTVLSSARALAALRGGEEGGRASTPPSSKAGRRSPRRRRGLATLLVLAASGFAFAALGPEPPSRTRTQITTAGTIRVVQDQYQLLELERDFSEVGVAQPEFVAIVGDQPTRDRKRILLLGKRPGRTTLFVRYAGGETEWYTVDVALDLSFLEEALRDIHPSLRVQQAPDRDALVLTGEVPFAAYARRAEEVAVAYVQARASGEGVVTGPAEARDREAARETAMGGTGEAEGTRGVINLFRVTGAPEIVDPPPIEARMRDAFAAIGAEGVEIVRIPRAAVPDDEADVFVLRGTVHDQIELVRVLSLAAKTLSGGRSRTVTEFREAADGSLVADREWSEPIRILDDIQPISNESGGLYSGAGDDAGRRITGNLLSGFGRGLGGRGGSSGGSGLSNARLENRLDSNIARAKALELADGRILSFLEVEYLPQVRVDIRVYEVNRTALLSYDGDFDVLWSDFNQGGLEPASNAKVLQGDEAARVGSGQRSDVQNVFGFLGGTLSNQLQVSGTHVAVDTVFSILESEGIARSLANPSLSVLSGETALFQVGGQIPIEESFATAVGVESLQTNVRFIDFGINLAVRPLVGDDGTVTIDFVPEVSNPDAQLTQLLSEATGQNPQTFAFKSRLLRTSARLEDGQTLLVGGLDQRGRNDQAGYAPWLAKVPLLGLLFQGFDYSDDDTEIVVMVRPSVLHDPLPEASLWIEADPGELFAPTYASLPQPPAPEGDAASGDAASDEAAPPAEAAPAPAEVEPAPAEAAPVEAEEPVGSASLGSASPGSETAAQAAPPAAAPYAEDPLMRPLVRPQMREVPR